MPPAVTFDARDGVRVREALVVAEVEVGLRAVLGDEDLAVLVGRHRAGIDVDVRIELLEADREAAGDEEPADRGGGDALAERRDDAAGDEDVAGLAVGVRHVLPVECREYGDAKVAAPSGRVTCVTPSANEPDDLRERMDEDRRRPSDAVARGAHARRSTPSCASRPPSAPFTGRVRRHEGARASTAAPAAAPSCSAPTTSSTPARGWPSFTDPALAEAVELRDGRLARHGPHRGRLRASAAATSATSSTTARATSGGHALLHQQLRAGPRRGRGARGLAHTARRRTAAGACRRVTRRSPAPATRRCAPTAGARG